MKSTKIALALALATAGLTLPGVAQERGNTERPKTERPKVERPQERPKTERPQERPNTERPKTERTRGEQENDARKDAEKRERAEGEKRIREAGGEHQGTDKDGEASERERTIDARKKDAEKPGMTKADAIRMAKEEEAKHRERMGKITRLRALAEKAGDRNKLRKIDELAKTETDRHARVLASAKERMGAENFEKLKKQLETGKRPAGDGPNARPEKTPEERPKTERPAERP